MRISVDQADPGYANFIKFGNARCCLNGALKATALTADDEAGEILCRHRDDVTGLSGDPEWLSGIVKIEFLRGSVKQPASAPIKHASPPRVLPPGPPGLY